MSGNFCVIVPLLRMYVNVVSRTAGPNASGCTELLMTNRGTAVVPQIRPRTNGPCELRALIHSALYNLIYRKEP